MNIKVNMKKSELSKYFAKLGKKSWEVQKGKRDMTALSKLAVEAKKAKKEALDNPSR